MKNKKIIISLVVILVLMSFGSMFGPVRTNLNSNSSIKTSQGSSLIPIDFPIRIDGNWSDYVELYDWCYGNGTEGNPYVIEGIHVSNENKSAYISIETAEYFIIRNVMVSEYSKPSGHYIYAGLYIEKAEYGLIVNCTFINCSNGISLYEAIDSLRITNCSFIGSHNDSITGLGSAILIHEAKGVVIDYNNIFNYYVGIHVRDAEEIYIDNNRIETSFGYISDSGIYFYGVNDSEITNNDLYGCEFAGHEYDDPFSSSVIGLRTSLVNCYNITVYGNRFYDLNGNLIGGLDELELNYLIPIVITIVVITSLIVIVYKVKKR